MRITRSPIALSKLIVVSPLQDALKLDLNIFLPSTGSDRELLHTHSEC